MPTLTSRLKRELANWKQCLPAAWRKYFQDVRLDFAGVLRNAQMGPKDAIWPQEGQGPAGAHLFKAFADLGPKQVRVVIFGNDPYTRIEQATGRSFEQGNLTDWATDVRNRGRISPSLISVLAATAATDRKSENYSLVDTRMVYDDVDPDSEQPLWFSHIEFARGVADKEISLPPPQKIFRYWASQGALWINRTLTYSRWDDDHRKSHRALWGPFTERVLEVLISQACNRRIVFALWGSSADDLEAPLEELRTFKGITKSAVRYVKTGHPQWPAGFFRIGNPLEEINKAIQGRPIRWA